MTNHACKRSTPRTVGLPSDGERQVAAASASPLREHVDTLVSGLIARLVGEPARDPAHDPIEDGHHVCAGGHRVGANASRFSSLTNTPSGISTWKCTLPVDQAAEPLDERDRSGLRGAEAALSCNPPLPRPDRAHELGDNPLPRFLPHEIPPGIRILCPTYPHLNWTKTGKKLCSSS